MRKWLRTDGWLAGGVGGVVAAPLSIVLHELGHFGAFVAFGLPDPVLRYASASWAGSGEWLTLFRAGDMAAAALAEPWKMAVAMAAGPAVSYLTAIICVFAVRRFGPGPLSLVLGLGLSAPGQGLGALMVLAINLFGGGFIGSQDEACRNLVVPDHSTRCRLPRARTLVPRDSHPSRSEGPSRGPGSGRHGSGPLPVDRLAGAPASSVI